MIIVALASAGMALGGVPGTATVLALAGLVRIRRRFHRDPPPFRVLLLILLVEVRLGRSVLAALQSASRALPEWVELGRVARLATVTGLTSAVEVTHGGLGRVLSQLARAQRSGAPLAETIRAMIEADIAAERSRSLARARSLPIRLMIPTTLLILPGLVLLFYGPALIRLFEDLASPF